MGDRKARRSVSAVVTLLFAWVFWLVGTAGAQTPPPAAPASHGGFTERIDRIELRSGFGVIDQDLSYWLGPTLVETESEWYGTNFGLRVFSTEVPVPVLDVSYTMTRSDFDATAWTIPPATMSTTDHDHDFRLGAMAPIPRVGLVKIGIYDTEATSAYGLYFVPEMRNLVTKLGVEWSINRGADEDLLGFGLVTLPYEKWRFSVGLSGRNEGDEMGGFQVGRELGNSFFVGAGGYLVEHGETAYAVMVGRYAQEGQKGPTFWFVHQNNRDWRRFNLNVAVGKPGIPQMALYNNYADGIYSAMFTDQIGEVLPVSLRSYEEGRIWVRPDEWAQEGAGSWGGLSLYADYIDTDMEYEILQLSVLYTRPRYGWLIYPHVGPVAEREVLPGVGTNWRYGLEFGTYLGERSPGKFYKAGRFYVGVRALSDFDDYLACIGEVRVNF